MATLNREMTYSALETAIAASALNRGERIIITDFQTIHNPKTLTGWDTEIITGETEALTVIATSSNTISKIAMSSAYPSDIIHYDFTDNLCEDGVTARKGKITYRENAITKVSSHCDFRNCKVLRYSMDAASWVSGTNYAKESFAKVDGIIYKKSGVDNPYTEANTISPHLAKMWIKYCPKGVPLFLGTPSVQYNVGVEGAPVLTGVAFTAHYLHIFEDGDGNESSDSYVNLADGYSSEGYSNNSFQNPNIKDTTLFAGSEGNTFAGSETIEKNVFSGLTIQNIFLGQCRYTTSSGVMKNNIFTKLNNVIFGSLVQGNIIVELASSSCISEVVFNDIKYAGNSILGSDIWGNVINYLGYSFLAYHFDRNFIFDVRNLTTHQKVEYCNFGNEVTNILVESELLYTNIPDGTRDLVISAPSGFGEFDLVTNVSSIINQQFYKKIVTAEDGTGYLQYVNSSGVSVNLAL